MADSVVDSTKNEDGSTDATESNVSSSLSTSSHVCASGGAGVDNETGQEVVSSSDTRDSTQSAGTVRQPSGGQQGFWAFGSAHNPGSYSNPFVPRPALRTDVVSTASCAGDERESIIAPSRLGAAVGRSTDERPKTYLRPSVLNAPNKGMADSDTPSSTHNSFHLRPSIFSGHSESTTPKAPLLKPAKLPDPTKVSDGKEAVTLQPETSEASEASSNCERLGGAESGTPAAREVTSSSTSDGAAAQACAQTYNHDIVPDIAKNNLLKDSSGVSSSSSSGFVFGSNISQRVAGVKQGEEAAGEASAGFVFGENLAAKVTDTNGSTESPHKEDSDSDSGKNRTLEESAREYQAKHDHKPELQEVERITGEEEESNVLQANAKLFLFESATQSWVERGRGTIRLNDRSSHDTKAFQSRLVMRTQGSLRVVLNTKIWPGMTIERASSKSVRITAMDTDESIKVFLIMTANKDSENLLRAIDWRIQELKIQEEPARGDQQQRAGEKRKAAAADFESPSKSKKLSSPSESGMFMTKKEESDSSVQDPETEASCESHSSSLTVKSESD